MKRYFAILLILCLILTGCNKEPQSQPMQSESVPPVVEVVPEPEPLPPPPALVSMTMLDEIKNRKRTMEVRTEPVTDEQAVQFAAQHPELLVTKFWLGDVSFYEIRPNDDAVHPMMIYLHGLGGRKEEYLASPLPTAGYCLILPDLYNHNERSNTYADFMAVMDVSVRDIDALVEYYRTVAYTKADRFVLGGGSMGACITYLYAQMGQYDAAAYVPMDGIYDESSLTENMMDWFRNLWLWDGSDQVPITDEGYIAFKMEYLTQHSAKNNIEAYLQAPIFSTHGVGDHLFAVDGVRSFFESVQAAGNANATVKIYENAGHNITDEMWVDVMAYLQGLAPTL